MGPLGSLRHVRVLAVAAVAAVSGAVAVASLGGASSGTASVVVPLDPVRILDTRSGVGAPAGPLGPGDEITLAVGGVAGVPANATAVMVNLTATQAASPGYVTAYPEGAERPEASVINYTPGADVANMITATLGGTGGLRLLSGDGTVHLVADVAAYLVPGHGAAGPAGPQGAAGPAGPGAVLIDAAVPVGPEELVTTLDGGIEVRVDCNDGGANSVVQLRTTPLANTFRYSSLWGRVGSGVTTSTFAGGIAGFAFGHSDHQHLSGLFENTAIGPAYQVELHLSRADPCIVWGSAIPLG
jgi:hypothetical protein